MHHGTCIDLHKHSDMHLYLNCIVLLHMCMRVHCIVHVFFFSFFLNFRISKKSCTHICVHMKIILYTGMHFMSMHLCIHVFSGVLYMPKMCILICMYIHTSTQRHMHTYGKKHCVNKIVV